jgi:hypothetical protein
VAEVLVPRGDGKTPNRYRVHTVPEVEAVLKRVCAMKLLAINRPNPRTPQVVEDCKAAFDQLLDLYSEFNREPDAAAG